MMKKVLSLVLLVAISFGMSSCTKAVLPEDIDGVYLGTMDVDAPWGGTNLGANGVKQKIYVTKNSDETAKLELRNFAFNGMKIGTIAIDNIALSKKGDLVGFAGSGAVNLIVGGCTVTVSGAVNPSGEVCEFDIAVQVVSETAGINFVGLNVDVAFTGHRLAQDQSSEAEIKTFDFKSSNVISQTTNGTMITFYVADGVTDLNFSPEITVSEGATITPASGSAHDFSTPVTYTVTSQDGITTTVYTVSKAGEIGVYDFEQWVTIKGSMYDTRTYQLPEGSWGSTNDGVTTINGMFQMAFEQAGVSEYGYAVVPTNTAKSGTKAVEIKTLYTYVFLNDMDYNAAFGGLIPYNTAGSLFLGAFITDMGDPLASTKFGIPYVGKPLKFSGWYKYAPGTVYRDNTNSVIAGKVDECDIYALLYEAEDENGNEVTLIGGSSEEANQKYVINTSPYVVLKAQLQDRTAKAEWTNFDLAFEPVNGKTYDPNKKYKITFVCTSSKEGAGYNGGEGSVLLIDDFRITK